MSENFEFSKNPPRIVSSKIPKKQDFLILLILDENFVKIGKIDRWIFHETRLSESITLNLQPRNLVHKLNYISQSLGVLIYFKVEKTKNRFFRIFCSKSHENLYKYIENVKNIMINI